MTPLNLNHSEEVKSLMEDFIARAVELYGGLSDQPVSHPIKSQSLKRLKARDIPADGRDIKDIYREMLDDVFSSAILLQHPRSFSCIPSTASLLSWMGDIMTNAYNPHASCQINAPAADLIEKKLIRWMCGLAGYPKTAGGLFVSGGSMANLTALTAARDDRLSYEDRDRAVIYVSDQTHSSVAKGLHILGFRRDQIRIVATDALFRMDIAALHAAISQDLAARKKPFAVVASAGTTNTGSIDPLVEIGALCRSYDMWMHVDGAFGASALLSEEGRKKLSGIEFSDSLSWDAHKWMLQTYGCSAVLVRNQSALVHSFAAHPEYLKDAESSADGVEFWDLGPELTRPARSLKLWITLQALGSRAMGQVIDHGCAMAELAERLLRKSPNWEIVSPAQLGIVNFRYVPDPTTPNSILDRINQAISREITESGFAQVFTTELRGNKVLRLCAIHPETTEQDICETIERMAHTQAVSKALQAAG